MNFQDYVDLTTSSGKLSERLVANAKSQSINFSEWLFAKMPDFLESSRILDLGCGTGLQTNFFLSQINSVGGVVAVDASQESLNSIPDDKKLTRFAADFNNFQGMGTLLGGKKFDIINSTYAIYYCERPIEFIEFMREYFLAPEGKFVITGPTWVHELYSLIVGEFGENTEITKTINFMESTLLPYVRSNYQTCDLHILNNTSVFESIGEVSQFLSNTSYAARIDSLELIKFLESKKVLEFKKTSLMAIF